MEELIISAAHEEKNYWRDLWRFRELLYFLAWKDILVRYKQTTVGIVWAVLRPVLSIVISTILSRKVAGVPEGAIPTVLMVSVGTLTWGLFSATFSEAGNSLVTNSNLISKIYFPRLLVPTATLAVAFVDFAISVGLFLILMVWYQYLPDFRALTVPFFIILALVASLGAGLWLSALTVRYRDFRFIVPFMVQIGFLVSPVWYTSDKFQGIWRILYSINPIVGPIDGLRWATFHGTNSIYWPGFAVSVATGIFLLWTSILYFRNTEKSFADMI